MPVTITAVDGFEINTLDDWLIHAPPQGAEAQWQDYRSAKELARAWLRFNPHMVPDELRALLDTRQETEHLDIQTAIAERPTLLDNFGGPRMSDILAVGNQTKTNKRIVVSVEAKADETCGHTIGRTLDRDPNGNVTERINHLSHAVFGCGVNKTIRDALPTTPWTRGHSDRGRKSEC